MEEEDATSATPFDFKIKRAIFFEAEATKHWVEAGGVEEEEEEEEERAACPWETRLSRTYITIVTQSQQLDH